MSEASVLGSHLIWRPLVLAAMLAAGLYWLWPDSKREDPRLFPLQASNINRLSLQVGKLPRLRLQRMAAASEDRPAVWSLVAPRPARADTTKVESLTQALLELPLNAPVVQTSPSQDDLKRFGLSPPAFLVSLGAGDPAGGKTPSTGRLWIGRANPFDASRYGRATSQGAQASQAAQDIKDSQAGPVLSLPGRLVRQLLADPGHWEQRLLCTQREETLVGLKLERPSGTFSLSWSPEQHWRLQMGTEIGPAATALATTFAHRMLSLQASALGLDLPALSPEGQQNPCALRLILMGRGQRQSLTFLPALEAPTATAEDPKQPSCNWQGGGLVYGSELGPVVGVSPETLTLLQFDPALLRPSGPSSPGSE